MAATDLFRQQAIPPQDIAPWIERQLEQWPEAAARFDALSQCLSREIPVEGQAAYRVVFNPARIVSTAANVDAKSIAARPCFLCASNRPTRQMSLDRGDYEILVNPFPIFPGHITIPTKAHTPQVALGRAADMARFALELEGYTIFYNGARCGASAPDHAHFQGVPDRWLPLRDVYPFATIRFVASPADAEASLQAIACKLPCQRGDDEPAWNLLCHRAGASSDMVEFVVIPRRQHRPDNYGSGDGQILLSPASVDLGGTVVAPRRQEFDLLDSTLLTTLFTQLCYDQI